MILEHQAFSPSFDFAPPPSPVPSAKHKKTEKVTQLADGEEVGEEPNHLSSRKLGPL